MKFRVVFIVFNVIILFSFLFIFLMPLAMLGWEYTRLFWSRNWYLAVLFLLVISSLNVYFIMNWQLFHYLEREDWPGLVTFLEERIYGRKQIRSQYVRILINTYLVRSDLESVRKLEQFLRRQRPRLVARFAIPLGIPHLLANDPQAMLGYFGPLRSETRGRERHWVRWNHAFSLMLLQKGDEAKRELLDLSGEVRDPVLRLLTFYLMDAFSDTDRDLTELLRREREAFRKRFPRAGWERTVERSKGNIQVIVLSKLIEEATGWAYREDAPDEGTSTGTVSWPAPEA